MSPEQAQRQAGRQAQRTSGRSACVLYEMLTGRRAFTGEGVSDTIAAVLRAEVDWTPLPPAVSPVLRTYLQRCLTKEPQQRIGDMQTMRLALEGALDITVISRAQDPQPGNLRRTGVLALAAALTGAVVTGIAVWFGCAPTRRASRAWCSRLTARPPSRPVWSVGILSSRLTETESSIALAISSWCGP